MKKRLKRNLREGNKYKIGKVEGQICKNREILVLHLKDIKIVKLFNLEK